MWKTLLEQILILDVDGWLGYWVLNPPVSKASREVFHVHVANFNQLPSHVQMHTKSDIFVWKVNIRAGAKGWNSNMTLSTVEKRAKRTPDITVETTFIVIHSFSAFADKALF